MKRDLCTRLALGALWLCAACTSPAAVLDGGTSGSTSGGTTTGTTTGGPGTAQMRLANLAPRGVATDLCTAVHGSGQFEGPLLGGKGLDAGVLFPAVSGYVSIPAGTFDFRLVAAGGDCSQNLPGTTDLTALPPLAAGGAFTLAEVAGSRQPVQIFEDDIASPDAGSAGLRFINASVDTPSLDLGSEQDGGFTPWVTGEQFLAVGGSAQIYSVDANGYLALPAMANVLLQIESQSKDLLDLVPPAGEPLALIDGALYTLFAVPGKPLDGLLCADSSLPSSGYTPCSLYPLPDGGATVSDGGDGG